MACSASWFIRTTSEMLLLKVIPGGRQGGGNYIEHNFVFHLLA